MNEVTDRSGAVLTDRSLQPTTDRDGPGAAAPSTVEYVELQVPGTTANAKGRRMKVDRRALLGLRDDTGGKCTFILSARGMPTVQVNGAYDTLVKLLPA